jgi:phage terminase small subunit
VKHGRWYSFCLDFCLTRQNAARSARRAGYSLKSARFIASRLIRKEVIRAVMRKIAGRYNFGSWGTPGHRP